jgi:CHAT domain-containing protein
MRVVASMGVAEHIAGLRLQIEAMRNPVMAQRHGDLLANRLRTHARALYERLWSPVDALVGDRQVVVVPHAALHDLPFGLLHDGQHWLVQRTATSVAPSAAVWLALARRKASKGTLRVLAVGALSGLANVGREIDSVAAAFGPAVVTLRDQEATAQRIRDAAASHVDILHLACHARFRADSPAFSNLVLTDGPLPMHELARWKLSAKLVVLSACETGVSRIAPGDEAFGLVRAVLLAGAQSVLATQWAVDDAATADLIQRFYLLLHAGHSPCRALHKAQSEAAQSGLHPYFWGPFTLYGPG